jgi:hypothetical protein
MTTQRKPHGNGGFKEMVIETDTERTWRVYDGHGNKLAVEVERRTDFGADLVPSMVEEAQREVRRAVRYSKIMMGVTAGFVVLDLVLALVKG